jgi:DNA-binding transcriptional ArsR family regulator
MQMFRMIDAGVPAAIVDWQLIGATHYPAINRTPWGMTVPKRNGQGIELLADPTRRRLIAAVALRPRRPSSLAQEIGLSRPATSRQLRLLRDAGLVRSSRSMTDRRALLFSVDPRSHGRITAWLGGIEIGRPTMMLDAHCHPAHIDDPSA